MKNIFKSLMLVAVAAMAFTACEKGNDETNKTEQKTVITGVATIANDDTRSGFTEKVGDAYQSAWDGGENIKSYYGNMYAFSTIEVDPVDGKGNFTAEFSAQIPEPFTIDVCAPASAWSDKDKYSIPVQQTPRENSVDPAAHILKAANVEVNNGSAAVTMNHVVAYGKVSFPDINLDGDTVSNVVLNIDDTEYKLITTATTDVWFACKPNGAVSNMTVTVNTVGGKVFQKTIVENANKDLKFNQGRVSAFNVKGLTEVVDTSSVRDITFTSAKLTGGTVSWGYIGITFVDAVENSLYVEFNLNSGNKVAGSYSGFSSNEAGTFFKVNYTPSGEALIDSTDVSSMTVVDNNPNFEFVINVELKDGTTLKGYYNGSVAGLSNSALADATIVSASAADAQYSGQKDVTFTFESGDKLVLTCNTGGKNYLEVGDWQTASWQSPRYVSYAKYNATDVVLSSMNVAYENDQYVITNLAFTLEQNNISTSYTGAIEGLDAPETGNEGGEDEPTDPEIEATELTISSHFTMYSSSSEHELGFYYDEPNAKFVDIDFLANPITAGTYTLTDGLSSMYCRSHGDYIKECTIIVTDNGSGNLTFDATFKAGDSNWYHFEYTADIYQ